MSGRNMSWRISRMYTYLLWYILYMDSTKLLLIVDEIKTSDRLSEWLNAQLCEVLWVKSLEDRGNFIDETTWDVVRVIRLENKVADVNIEEWVKIENGALEIVL